MRIARVIGVAALVLMVAGLVVGTGCGTRGPQGIQGIQGPKGDTGAQGPPGSFSWGTPTSYGPYQLNIGIGSGDWFIPSETSSLGVGDRVEFSFTVAGAAVYYWVDDANENIILTGHRGDYVVSGQGAFIAASSGTYILHFQSHGTFLDTSLLTINYKVYPAL
jgi:hypothetical protein